MKPIHDLDGNPIKPPVKCQLCGKEKGLHRARTLECPGGMRTRIGYTNFGPGIFTPRQPKPRKG